MPRSDNRGVAGEEMRRHNLGTILEQLHLTGPASRSELVASTGLNRSTIADLVGQLTDLGFVVEGPAPVASGPGRPSLVVSTHPQGASVLAVEVDVDSIAVATLGLGGHVFNRLRVDRPRGRFSPDETIQDVAKLAAPLLSALPDDRALVGVGVAVAGITRRPDGFVRLAPNLGWQDIPLGEMLAKVLDLNVPVRVANEADLGALGEHRRGHHAQARNLIYISGEVGIGAGVIVDGEPLLGAEGYAGEAGHTMINPGGVKCRCGSSGCWETEAGEAALVRRVRSLRGKTGAGLVEAVIAQAAARDPEILAAITEVGTWLGLGIGNLINIFNPDLVVLGGLYSDLYAHLESPVVAGARRSALVAPFEAASIIRGALGGDAPLIGAAELALAGVLSDPAKPPAP
jgi:predicted NBD/HSP70 family sugar kinase